MPRRTLRRSIVI